MVEESPRPSQCLLPFLRARGEVAPECRVPTLTPALDPSPVPDFPPSQTESWGAATRGRKAVPLDMCLGTPPPPVWCWPAFSPSG